MHALIILLDKINVCVRLFILVFYRILEGFVLDKPLKHGQCLFGTILGHLDLGLQIIRKVNHKL